MSGILSPYESRRPVFVAGFVAGLTGVVVAAILPYARLPVTVIQPVFSIFATAAFFVNGVTAYFLTLQFRATREPFLGALAGAYAFVAVAATVQALMIPIVLYPNAQPPATSWIWLVSPACFTMFILAALLLHAARLHHGKSKILHRASLLLLAGGPVTACLLPMLIILGHAVPPRFMHGSLPVAVTANILVLAACVKITRLRDVLSLWVGVSVLSNFCVMLLIPGANTSYSLAGGSLGWYAGDLLSIISSAILLCVLIFEFDLLYNQLLASTQSLMQRALHDGLTGAFNRGYFIEQAPRELRRAMREHAPLSLLLIDVDHFKSYNDKRGHQMGDQCLVAIVAAIRRVTRRPADFVARYGGEEFAVVLPRTDDLGAQKLADAVRAEIFELRLRRDDVPAGFVTVSMGIATFDPAFDKYDTDELVRRADQALYQAKHEGRDTSRAYKLLAA